MKTWGFVISTVALVVSFPAVLFAQQSAPVQMIRVSPAINVPSDNPFEVSSGAIVVQSSNGIANATTTPTAKTSADAKADQKEQLFLAALQQLQFDRRPSMILRTWAELEAAAPKTAGASANNPATAEAAQAATSSASPTATAEIPGPSFDAPPRPLNATEIAAREAKELADMTAAANEEAKKFQQLVIVGEWEKAAEILRTLKVSNQYTVYQLMMQQFLQVRREFQQLAQVDDLEQGAVNDQQYFERNRFTLDDLTGILKLAPKRLERADLVTLGQIGQQIVESGVAEEALQQHVADIVAATPNADYLPPVEDESDEEAAETDVAEVTTENAVEEESRPIVAHLTRRQAAWFLLYCQQLTAVEDYLPTAEECQKSNDAEGLNLIARLTMSKSLEDDPDKLINAWKVLQVVIDSEGVPKADRNEALLRAVSLVPHLDKEVGVQWLKDLFASDESKTKEILAVMAERVTRGMQTQPHSADSRGNSLMMLKVAADALYEVRPEWATEWQDLMDLMATAWLREARFSQMYDTSTSLGPQLQRDQYGNFYYYSYEQMYGVQRMNNRRMPSPISIEVVLDAMPEGNWFEAIDASLRPEISSVCANMLLKVNEDEKAFPYIEALAKTHVDKAQDLAEQFIRVWTENHDMNATRGNNRYTPYYYMYGFNQSAESIPLTRSKQERNLKDLTKWVAALRELEGVEVDQKLLAAAFTTCHSGAEVYRFDQIETVFGPLSDMDPDVLAALCQQMRTNLSGQWLVPDVQKQNNTKRSKKDILQQVLNGYSLARQTIDQAIEKHPDSWTLQLERACLLFDDNEYRSVLTPRNEYSQQKAASFAAFEKAAHAYAKATADAKPNDYSVEVFEKWFYAMLGATDLKKVEAEAAVATKQTEKIKQAILQLGDHVAEEHLKLFANVVVTRVGMANPGVKFSFLTEGFKITGERREVTQAMRLHEYYRDLVTELELEAIIDGTDTISPGQPFGVYIRINHTPEIERESGGFGRFLQNQNSMNYAYNYGRPTANYRDKFEEAARTALADHFEVLSVTFERESIKSRPLNGSDGHNGWHTTPYAYILLEPRGTEVDRLPELKMDLDFLDTTGYIVLPIQTTEIPLDCQSKVAAARPYQDLKVTQTLDQREGKEGKLSLEIKASCSGLVPDLEHILNLDAGEFEITEIQDSKPMVSSFDKESMEPIVVSERIWDIKLAGKEGLNTKPDEFQFGEAKEGLEFAEWSLMGFNDEDIVAMEPTVVLEGEFGEAATPWGTILTVASAGLLGIVCLSILFMTMGGEKQTAKKDERLENLTPFALLAALSSKLESGNLSKSEEAELREEMHRLEQSYFADYRNEDATSETRPEERLNTIAKRWL